MIRFGLAFACLASLALPAVALAQTDPVDTYATCLLDGVSYDLGQRRDVFDSNVVRRSDQEKWDSLTVMRYGWLMHSPLVSAFWKEGARHMTVAYRPGPLGETDARFGWIALDAVTLDAGQGDGTCTIVKEHRSSSTLLQQDFDMQAGDTILSACQFSDIRITFSTNADKDYRQFGQLNDRIEEATSLYSYVARDSLRRAYAYDDGFATYLVAHQPDGTAKMAFTLLSKATLGGGSGIGTCEVFP